MPGRTRITSLLGAIALLLLGSSAFAVTRSCQVHYSAAPTSITDGASWTFSFSASGTISTFAPNTARKRARRAIDACLDAHWRNFTAAERPVECTEARNVTSYPVDNLAQELQEHVCRANHGNSTIVVRISVTYSGDEGCRLDNNSWAREITRNHLIVCPPQPLELRTNRPGMDYSEFEITEPGARYTACRDACTADPECRAWSFGGPSTPGAHPHCWLKECVPPAQMDRDYLSGVPERP